MSRYLKWNMILVVGFYTIFSAQIYAAIGVTVTSNLDYPAANPATSPDSTLGAGIVTLRSAIEYVNAFQAWVDGNTIAFNIPGAGVQRIQPGGPDAERSVRGKQLPVINRRVDLDGYTQPGSQMNSLVIGSNAIPLIEINGSHYTVGDGIFKGIGLAFNYVTQGSRVRGLILNEWSLYGLALLPGSAASLPGQNPVKVSDIPFKIVGNFIGTNAKGTQVLPNRIGIYTSALNACIGTSFSTAIPLVSERNIIAGSFNFPGNFSACIQVEADGVVIKNNYIGLDKSGRRALGRSRVGIRNTNQRVVIGGTTEAERNVISGLSVHGIDLSSDSHNCIVSGNYIGLDATGSRAVGKQTHAIGIVFSRGLYQESVTNNTIGGMAVGSGNVISGWATGILIGKEDFRTGTNLNRVVDNLIQGNLIGTDSSGANPVPNLIGILVADNSNSIEENFIAASKKYGILLECGTHNNLITNNTFGKGKLANGKNILDLSKGKNLINQ